jgi:hypothetical protein
MRICIGTLLIVSAWFFSSCSKPVSVLLITGGHEFDTIEFLQTFQSLEGINTDPVYHPVAMERLRSGGAAPYDVLVFYDFLPDLPVKDSLVFRELARTGKPMLFLHHALCSFQGWDGYMEMVGGRYVMPGYGADSCRFSNYRHDIDMIVRVSDPHHPVTREMADFTIHDEGYSNITVLPGMTPLLESDHPEASPLIGWTHRYDRSQTVYLMLGHDKRAYQNPAFQQLLRQSVHWLAKGVT